MKKTVCGFLASVFLISRSWACGLVYSEGSAARLVTEKTLIVWNEKEKTEDFIRSPQIETGKSDVGFIVPVPAVPEVSEIDNNIFNELDQLVEERRPKEFKFRRDPALKDKSFEGLSKGMGPSAPGTRGAVVVKEFNLSKYEVKVVKADDLEAFKKWLEENDYAFRPAFESWLKNYVNDRFFLTVFKFKKDNESEGLKAQAVSIKFKADAPFYPYRDSSDTPVAEDRNLKLYFLADQAFAPDFGGTPENKPRGFQEKPEFSARVKLKPQHDQLHFDNHSWLTIWRDTTAQRPDTDLTFKAAVNSEKEILPAAKTIYAEDYIALVFYAVFGGVLILVAPLGHVLGLLQKLF